MAGDRAHCMECGRAVYLNGEGVWFGPDGKAMCPSCAPKNITPAPRRWNPEKGCWEKVEPGETQHD